MFRLQMALRSAVTRLLSTSHKSVAVTAARAQGTAVPASRGACQISCIITNSVHLIYSVNEVMFNQLSILFNFILTDGEDTPKKSKTGK